MLDAGQVKLPGEGECQVKVWVQVARSRSKDLEVDFWRKNDDCGSICDSAAGGKFNLNGAVGQRVFRDNPTSLYEYLWLVIVCPTINSCTT